MTDSSSYAFAGCMDVVNFLLLIDLSSRCRCIYRVLDGIILLPDTGMGDILPNLGGLRSYASCTGWTAWMGAACIQIF